MIALQETTQGPIFLTKEEVCERWRGVIKPVTIRKMITTGDLVGIRLGGKRVMVTLDSVLAYEEKNRIVSKGRG